MGGDNPYALLLPDLYGTGCGSTWSTDWCCNQNPTTSRLTIAESRYHSQPVTCDNACYQIVMERALTVDLLRGGTFNVVSLQVDVEMAAAHFVEEGVHVKEFLGGPDAGARA